MFTINLQLQQVHYAFENVFFSPHDDHVKLFIFITSQFDLWSKQIKQ